MRWDEYLEDVTEEIPNPRRAREIRRELRDHLESAAEAGVAEGLSRAEAEARALTALGPAPVLAARFRAAYPAAPLWPAVIAVLAALAGVGLILWPATHQQPGISAGLLFWAALWATGHPKSFLSLLRRSWRVAFPWQLVAAAWPFLGAGVLTAAVLVFLLNAGRVGVTMTPLPLFPLIAWLLWEGANALCGRRAAVHPVGSGLGALSLLITLGTTWSVTPQWGPLGPMLGPATPWTELPWATLLAVLYFTGAAILANAHTFARSRLDRVADGLLPEA